MERLPVIAILGKARSGKDTAGKMLLAEQPGIQGAFAFKLKQIVGEMFGFTEHDLYDDKGKEAPTRFKCLRCPVCSALDVEIIKVDREDRALCKPCGAIGEMSVFDAHWTPRSILQHIGTEGFRRIDPDIWARYTLEALEKELARDSFESAKLTTGEFNEP